MASVVTDAALAWAAANWSPLAQLLAGEIAANQASYVAGSAASVAYQLGRITAAAAYSTTTTAAEAAYANALSANWSGYYAAAIEAITTRDTTGQAINRDYTIGGQTLSTTRSLTLVGISETWCADVNGARTTGRNAVVSAGSTWSKSRGDGLRNLQTAIEGNQEISHAA